MKKYFLIGVISLGAYAYFLNKNKKMSDSCAEIDSFKFIYSVQENIDKIHGLVEKIDDSNVYGNFPELFKISILNENLLREFCDMMLFSMSENSKIKNYVLDYEKNIRRFYDEVGQYVCPVKSEDYNKYYKREVFDSEQNKIQVKEFGVNKKHNINYIYNRICADYEMIKCIFAGC